MNGLSVLTAGTDPVDCQVYALPDLSAVITLGPARNDRSRPGTLSVVTDDLQGGDVTLHHRVLHHAVHWQDGTFSVRDLGENPTGNAQNLHPGQDHTLHGNDALRALLIQETPPVWMVKHPVSGGQNGLYSGDLTVTHGRHTYPGWYEEQDEPVDCTVYGIAPEAAQLLRGAGVTVFSEYGQFAYTSDGESF